MNNKMINLIIFGDTFGIPMLINCVKECNVSCNISAIVAASIRPHQHEELGKIANYLSIPLIIQPKRDDKSYPFFVRSISKMKPDFIIVNSYSMKLHPEVLAIPKIASINVHGGLLPEYRGANPIQWAIINAETETGVTIHYMTEEIDAGDIISQKRVPIFFEDTWLDVRNRLYVATEEILREELPKIFEGKNSRVAQDESKSRYWKRRKPEDGLIDWYRPALYIYNLIRALVKPLPGAFYFDKNGQKITIDYFVPYEEVRKLQKRIIGYVIE